MCSSFNTTLEHDRIGKWRRIDGMQSIAPYQCRTREVIGNMRGMHYQASRKWNEMQRVGLHTILQHLQ